MPFNPALNGIDVVPQRLNYSSVITTSVDPCPMSTKHNSQYSVSTDTIEPMTDTNSPKEPVEGDLKSVQDYIRKARLLLRAKKHSKAIKLLETGYEKWSVNLQLSALLVEAYLKNNQPAAALSIYENLSISSDIPHWVDVGQGNILEGMNKIDDAALCFCRGLSKQFSVELLARITRLAPFVKSKNELLVTTIEIVNRSPETKDNSLNIYIKEAEKAKSNSDFETAALLYEQAHKLNLANYKITKCLLFCLLRNNNLRACVVTLYHWNILCPKDKRLNRVEDILTDLLPKDPKIRTMKELLSPEYYRYRYRLVQQDNDNAFRHFLAVGIENNFDPNPWFNSKYFIKSFNDLIEENETPLETYIRLENSLTVTPSTLFDPVYYLDNYPDLKNTPSLLAHYTAYGYKEGRCPIQRKLLPEAVHNEFLELCDIEPKLASADRGLRNIVRYPRYFRSQFLPESIASTYGEKIEAILCVPFLSKGGADLVSTLALQALQDAYGIENVLLLVTDQKGIDTKNWLRDETQVCILENECTFEGDDDKSVTLLNLVCRLAPQKILNVNSRLCWNLYKDYGKQLSSVMDLFSYLFCYDYDSKNRRVGYITEYLPLTIKNLKSVYFDNQNIVDSVIDLYGFSDSNKSKLVTLYTPVDSAPPIKHAPQATPKILWIGRLAQQKRVDKLLEIADSLTNCEFHVYGEIGNSSHADEVMSSAHSNIIFKGTYKDIKEIDLPQFSLFLLTSQWEGIPTILLSMIAMGIPVVAPNVGGIGEAINSDTGWLVSDNECAEEFSTTIRKLLSNPDLANRKSKNGTDLIQRRHTWSNFTNSLKATDLLKNNNLTIVKSESSSANAA